MFSIPVHITFANSPVGKAIIQVVGEPVQFMETADDADKILFARGYPIVGEFSRGKKYAYCAERTEVVSHLPDNIVVIRGMSLTAILKFLE